MLNNIVRILFQLFFAALAIFFLSLGISTFLIRYQIVQTGTYENALTKNHAYETIENVIEESIKQGINQGATSTDLTTSDYDKQLVTNIINQVFNDVYKKDEIQALVRISLINNTNSVLNWVEGNANDIYLFFPTKDLRQKFGASTLNEAFKTRFNEALKSNRPICTDEQLRTYIKADQKITTQDIVSMPCIPKDIKDYLNQSSTYNFAMFDSMLDEMKPLDESTPYTEILASTYGAGSQEVQNFKDFQTLTVLSSYVPYILIGIGIVSFLFTLILTKKTIKALLRSFSLTLLFTGVGMLIIGLINLLFLSNGINNATQEMANSDFSYISSELAVKLVNMTNGVLKDISNSIILPVIIVGGGAFVITTILLIISILIKEKERTTEVTTTTVKKRN